MDYVLIGAGPAGLQLGYHLEAAGRDYRILEAGQVPGAFFETFPRHRTLISINKPHTGWEDSELNLRMDWNSLLSDDPELRFTRYSERYFPAADELLAYLRDYATTHQLRIEYDARATRVERIDGGFRVTDARGREWCAPRLVVATGLARPYVPAIPGIEAAELYSEISTDPRDFLDQRVLVIGKGNSAFETADHLMETTAYIHVAGPRSLRLAWRTHYVGHLRAVNNNFLDSYQLKSQNAVIDGDIERIERRSDGRYVVTARFVRAGEVKKDLVYDRVIVCTGFRFDASIFAESCRPDLVLNDRFPEQTVEWESANVPGLYFAGTLMQARDYRRSTTGFIHGFRYAVRALHHMLERRHHGRPWPHRSLEPDAHSLMKAVIERVNRTSALWQQFDVLCDLVDLGEDGVARYFEEVPVAYAHEHFLGSGESYLTVTLEYGPDHDRVDPFDVEVRRIEQGAVDAGGNSQYLHPVVRHFRRGKLLAEHHVTENLENEWNGPNHTEPLRAFLAERLAPRGDDPAAAA